MVLDCLFACLCWFAWCLYLLWCFEIVLWFMGLRLLLFVWCWFCVDFGLIAWFIVAVGNCGLTLLRYLLGVFSAHCFGSYWFWFWLFWDCVSYILTSACGLLYVLGLELLFVLICFLLWCFGFITLLLYGLLVLVCFNDSLGSVFGDCFEFWVCIVGLVLRWLVWMGA